MKHNLLKSVIISVILLMGVSNAWGVDHTGGYIYFLKPSTWTESKVMMLIGHDSYTSVYEMTLVSNTNNLYRYTMPSWSGATYVAFANDKNVWESEKWGPNNRTNAPHYTNVYNDYRFDSGSYYVIVPANTSKDAGITINYTGTTPSSVNRETKAIASNKAHGTVSVSGYYLSSATAVSTRSAVSSTASNATASTTLAPASTITFKATANPGYKFIGWYDAESGGNQLSTSTTYTVTYDISFAGKTVYARFEKTYAVTISAGANGTVSPSDQQQVGSTRVTIKATANTGYKFKNWTTTGGVVIANANNATTTITATAPGTVKANFEEDLSSNWKLIGDNQTNSPFGDNYTYSNGKAMTKKSGHSTESNVYITLDIKHLPASYYGFKVATSNSDNDKYGYGQGGGDYIEFNRSASNSQKQVYSGSQHELKFIPDALGEYEFRVNYPSNKYYVYVTFPTAYAVTFGTGIGGTSVTAKYNSTSFNTGTKVQSGKTVTFTQTASAGYTFKEWNTKSDGTGTKLSTNATYTRTVAATNTVYAIYTKNPDNIVYLKPSHSWKSNNAQFAVKYGGTNHMMTEAEECCEEKYYKVIIPSQYSKFNFVRLSDNGTTEWNVTGEISVPTDGKNLYDMTKIYLKPNANWKSYGARFAAYFFVNGYTDSKKKWMSMLPTDEDGVFYCDFPTEHTFDRVSLTRMNGAESYNDWAYRLNQTKDIELFQGYNSYELEEDKWGKDNSNPQVDDNMNVIYKCKWTTYNPTYSVTLEPTPYGHYTVEYNGRTYKSATDKNVVIEDVALGATIRVSKGTPDNSAEYTDDMLLQKASGYVKTELKGGEYYDHTICGTTTITENFVTKNPHTVYLRVPTTVEAAWNDDDLGLSQGGNCVYYTHILGGGIALMQDVTETINGEDGYSYYQLTIPAGYRTFCFQRKSKSEPQNYLPRNYTKDFTHILPFINGLNCFTILGSNDDYYYYGEWGTLLQNGDYRLLYVEQVVEKDANGNIVVTRKKAHPSNIIKKGTARQIVSLHTYKERTYTANAGGGLTYTSSNNPEIILQRCTAFVAGKSQWEDVECQMVYGPLETLPIMANLPGRKNASPNSNIDDLQYQDGIENIKKDVLNHQDEGNGVWNFVVTQVDDKASVQWKETQRYTGEYYIRTDVAEGGWDQYTLNDNYMTYSQYAKDHSGFSHYFCRWVEKNITPNTKFVIANDHGVAISDTLSGDQFTDIHGNIQEDANIRWSWNMVNNEIARAYIQGTWKKDGNEGERNRNLVVNYKPSSEGAVEDLLDDSGDWIYQKDFPVKVGSHLNSLTAQYPVTTGPTQTFASNLDMLTGDPAVNDKDYKVRILYDFKINKTLVALVPNANEASIAIDVVIERINQDEATQVLAPIAYTNNQRSGEGSTVYGVMSFDKSHLTGQSLSSQQKLTYWISFPFDVKLSEIFGFGEVGDYWMIKYYDGKDRAAKGLYDDNTFWKFITNRNYTLKANQGYVLALNKKVMDANSPIFTNTTRISLYFPSKEKLLNIDTDYTQTTCTIPEYTCTITSPTDRRTKDSNWNFIGVPSFANKNRNTTNENLMYFYDYDYQTDTYSVALNNRKENKFKSMFAYMVQFAGIIDWSTLASNGSQGLAAKKTDNVEKHVLRIELQQNNTKVDQTYIQLEDEEVTAMFDMNYDLTKLFNSKTNIYSLIPSDTDPIQVAANVMPIEETIIPLGIKLDAAGEYTFAMPDGTDGIVVELIDYEANTTTNMLLDEYTVNLGKGTFENRFALHVKPNKTTTSLEDVNTNTTGVKKYLIDGVLYMQKDGVLYDAQGRKL